MLDRRVTRLIGLLTIVGAALAVIFNILHPTPDDVDNVRSAVQAASDEGIWAFDHYILGWTVGIALLAFIGISRSLTREPSISWGRIALVFGIGSAAFAFSTLLIDGWGVKEAAEAQSEDFAVPVAYVAESLFIGTIGTFFGITPLLFGAALLSGDDYPAWLGWTPVVSGLVGVVAGTWIYFDGFSDFPINVLFLISSLLFTIWLGIMGYQLWSKTSEPAAAASPVA